MSVFVLLDKSPLRLTFCLRRGASGELPGPTERQPLKDKQFRRSCRGISHLNTLIQEFTLRVMIAEAYEVFCILFAPSL